MIKMCKNGFLFQDSPLLHSEDILLVVYYVHNIFLKQSTSNHSNHKPNANTHIIVLVIIYRMEPLTSYGWKEMDLLPV